MEFSRQESWERVAISCSRGSSPGTRTCVSYIDRQIIYHCITWEVKLLTICPFKTNKQILSYYLTFHENIFMITYMFQRQKFLNDFMLDFLLLNINISIGN